MNAFRFALSAFACLSLGALSLGCSTSTCDRDAELIKYCGGSVRGNFYESSDWKQGYLFFPPARTIRFFHHLHDLPANPQIYLGFLDHGYGLAPTAGNQAIIESVTDQSIDVKNDTCSEFYIRLTAERPIGDDATGAAGSSATSDDADCANP